MEGREVGIAAGRGGSILGGMFLTLFVATPTVTHADTWGAWDDGFVSPTRDEAPTDGVVIYAANYVPRATVVVGPGAPFPLDASLVTGVGAPPRVALHPPEGGWVPGEAYALSVLGYYEEEGEVATFEFIAGNDLAPPPGAFTLGEVDVGAWSEETTYPWGCCFPVRDVTIDVDLPEADPWSRIEIVGRFDLGRPSQITTQEIHTHLDLALGAGPHTLQFLQWEDEIGPQPPCVDVVSISAAGEIGASETVCTVDEVDRSDGGTGGCSTSGLSGFGVALPGLALLFARRRRERDQG